MILYPAIDIRDGQAVRLVQGDFEREKAYDADPVDAARRWVDEGARALHVVDLDGARAGEPGQHRARRAHRAPRSTSRCRSAAACARRATWTRCSPPAPTRAVLGTAALSDPALVEALAAEHGDAVVVSVDARGGTVAVRAGSETTGASAAGVIADLAGRGVRALRLHAGRGRRNARRARGSTRCACRRAAAAAGAELIYSGGVGELDDLRRSPRRPPTALRGVIVGRALYEGRFTVAEGQAALGAD